MLIDTHCHIHEANYPLDVGDVLTRAHHAGVNQMICVGTSVQSSSDAVAFSAQHEHIYASIGVHPHDTKEGWEGLGSLIADPASSAKQVRLRQDDSSASSLYPAKLGTPQTFSDRQELTLEPSGQALIVSSNDAGHALRMSSSTAVLPQPLQPELQATPGPDLKPGAKPLWQNTELESDRNKVVAIGEIGLDYFYTHSPRETQIKALEWQIDLALHHNLPIIFHVREAFDDFWPIFDNFSGIRGELHSFTDSTKNMEEAIRRGLFIGVNGISTFTKASDQQQMFANIPLKHMLLETDAPFLTPVPLRGKVNEPAFVRHIAAYHASQRGVTLEEIASVTTANARALFALL